MILVDVNLLVYAWDVRAPQHEAARTWLDARLSETGRVAMPWESWAQVREWLACENVWIPHANEEHGIVVGALLRELGGGSRLIPDAHLAALAIEHGLVLCSTDGDFARFPGLRWMNPIRG